MIKSLWVLLVISPFLFLSCEGKKNVDNGGQIDKAMTELQKMKMEGYIKYDEAKEAMGKMETPSTQRLDLTGSCNIHFLASIQDSMTLPPNDFYRLISLNTEECKDRVEFQQFYNEVLINSIDRNPALFYTSFTNPKLRQYKKMIIEQIKNPIHDGLDPQKTLNKVSQELRTNLRIGEIDDDFKKLLSSLN